jgi:hypothetical protein
MTLRTAANNSRRLYHDYIAYGNLMNALYNHILPYKEETNTSVIVIMCEITSLHACTGLPTCNEENTGSIFRLLSQ